PIATHLKNAGHELVLYARRPDVFDGELMPLIDGGATPAASPAELAGQVDVILVNVMAGPDVRSVLLDRDDAVIHGLGGRHVTIADHSTIDPGTAADVHTAMKAAGAGFVDAPVSGGKIGAEAGTLVTMVGGDDEDVARMMPVIAHYTANRVHVGASGRGQIAKLCNQIAQVITIQGVAEALHFAEAHGADKQGVFDVMSSGFAASRMLELLGPKMIADDFSPLMQSRLLDKDIGIAFDASQDVGIYTPALEVVRDQLRDVQDRGWQVQDISILFEALKPKKS
ncbi:MAG: NAD(P)-dependent oxidoreductase, partial [Alphaproteobacteria bacterium]|nr:NAD(P)-dependent oxidoreductase [Alphaproteobacteria bacterium]